MFLLSVETVSYLCTFKPHFLKSVVFCHDFLLKSVVFCCVFILKSVVFYSIFILKSVGL